MHSPRNAEPYLYPATPTLEPEDGTTVVFRDLPEAITCSDDDVMAMGGTDLVVPLLAS